MYQINRLYTLNSSFPGGSVVKNLPTVQETQVWSLGWEYPLGREWQPPPECLPGKSQGQRSLVGYNPWGRKRVGHNLVTKQQQQYTYTTCIWEGEKLGTWKAKELWSGLNHLLLMLMQREGLSARTVVQESKAAISSKANGAQEWNWDWLNRTGLEEAETAGDS